jgi:carboxyl-terminal processing protease
MLLFLATGVVLGVGLSLGASVIAERQPADPGHTPASSSLPWEDARLLAEVLHRIEADYVDDVDDHELMENAVRGMVAGLDAHSAFLDRDEYEEMQDNTSGVYPGIGIEVAANDKGIEVLRPIEGAPAQRAGIMAGDLIVKIDDVEVPHDDVDAAIDSLHGRVGTSVKLTVRRGESSALLDFSVKRARVEVHSATYALLEQGYGYIRISQFSETTANDVQRAVRELRRASNKPITGVVLDLRNNPGGLLDSAVQVADDFLDSGNIVSADGRTPDARFRMDAQPGDLLKGAGLAVLVNGGSASAAEILAGALHDNHRATLIGRKTYGKGSVQTVVPLSEGRAVKLTTSRYFTPSGSSINEIGIEPDIRFTGSDEAPAALDARSGKTSLATRDVQVSLALDTLKRAPRLAGATPATR